MTSRSMALLLLLVLVGCGAGMLDYSDQIAGTRYKLVRTDSQSLWVFPQKECGEECPRISRNVVKVLSNKQVIAVRRQVVRDYRCDGATLASQYFDLYQQYVIVLKSNKLIGPLSVAEYQKFAAASPGLLAGIDLLEPADLHDGSGRALQELRDCTNARPV